jgi:hypothetical protein
MDDHLLENSAILHNKTRKNPVNLLKELDLLSTCNQKYLYEVANPRHLIKDFVRPD